MIDNIVVIENVVPKSYQDAIEHSLLGEMMSSWLLLNDISYGSENLLEKFNPGLVHPIKVDGQIKSPLFNFLLPLVFFSLEKINYQYKDTFMARSFLQFPKLKSVTNNPHTDLTMPHLVCLYYVNDSDGDTIIYNETLDDVLPNEVNKTQFTIKQQISPKKGKIVMFDGKYYHSSSSPTTDRRCIVNFDVV